MSIKSQIPADHKRWYAVKCKFRCEKLITEDFKNQGIECYIPIKRSIKQYASRKKKSEVALIPSHVFVHISQDEYLEVLRHQYTFSFVNFSGVVCPIPDKEMEMMKWVVGECENVEIDQSSFSIGDRVQIIGGDLTGLEGELIENQNHNFKISLTSLQVGLLIQVDPKHLLKIGSRVKVA